MFVSRRELLRAKSGTLTETPLPLLLHALLAEERTATLQLKLRNLEKRVHVDGGVITGCESNLLHETLGRRLVAKGKLTEAQHHGLLGDAALVDKPLHALLLERQLISGSELFKLLQSNLGLTLLDAFRWADAQWKLLPLEDVDTPIRMNTAQLVYTGAMQLPAETIAAHFAPPEPTPFALLGEPGEQLRLSSKDTRLVGALKKRATLGALLALPGFTRDEVLRRVYALCVLELADTAEAADARPRFTPTPPPVAMPLPAPRVEVAVTPLGVPFADHDEQVMNLLASEFLSIRGKDAFDTLGVGLDAKGAALQRAFLGKCAALPPAKFQNPDARTKAEVLLMAYARAYGALSDAEQYAVHRKRRETHDANKKRGGPNPAAAAEAFKIRTELLDASQQFNEGKKRLDAGQVKSAVEHFEYAADIEPSGRTLAWLALARFRLNPDFAAEKSLDLLADACQRDASCEEAWAFRADLALSIGRRDEAMEAYKQAARLNPAQKRYAAALKG